MAGARQVVESDPCQGWVFPQEPPSSLVCRTGLRKVHVLRSSAAREHRNPGSIRRACYSRLLFFEADGPHLCGRSSSLCSMGSLKPSARSGFVKTFCSFKGYGDFVVACRFLRARPPGEYRILASAHLKAINSALGSPVPVTWVDLAPDKATAKDGFPAIYDLRRQGLRPCWRPQPAPNSRGSCRVSRCRRRACV